MIEESSDYFNDADINTDEEEEIVSQYLDQVKQFHQPSKKQSSIRNNPFLWKQIAAFQNNIDGHAQDRKSGHEFDVLNDPNENYGGRFDDAWRSFKVKKDLLEDNTKE